MRAAYLYQAINLFVVVLMVPLLLRYLDVNEYVLWSIFTTFGGITLQIENAIQMVSVREIAREYHSGNAATLQAAIRKARAAYKILSVSIIVTFLTLGLLYLHFFVSEKLYHKENTEWFLFTAAYALNYYFGTNNSILLGMAHISRYNNTNSQTRILNFICTYLFLKAGLSILGICLSFIFSVLVGCAIIYRSAEKSLNNYYSSLDSRIRPFATFENSNPSNTIKYTFYMLASFTLYKGGLLVAATIFPKDVIGSYGLTLQANALLSTLALVPVQVWLRKLVSAIARKDRQEMLHELAVTMAIANTVFIAGSFLLALFGNMLLLIIGSKLMLPGNVILLLVGLAFLIELNIFLLVNFLVTAGHYNFVKVYLTTSLISIVLVIFLTSVTKSSVATLILLPLSLQSFLCLPMIFRMACRELAITPLTFLSHLIRYVSLRP
jgi:hypothetical protein